MLIEFLFLLVSLAVLVWSADKMVAYSVNLAVTLGVSSLVVGLTIVALGTSLPELASSVIAVIEGHGEIALGNAIGSNICNLGLIVGGPAIVASIAIVPSESKRLSFWLLGSSLLFSGLVYAFGILSSGSGVLMLVLLMVYVASIIKRASLQPRVIRNLVSQAGDLADSEDFHNTTTSKETAFLLLKLGLCLALIVLSSEQMVNSIISVAGALGVSEEIIALSLVAFGTSLPELSVSVAAAKRGESEILVGNVVGSNVANLFMVVGLSALIGPLSASRDLMRFDIPIMLMFTVLFVLFIVSTAGVTRSKGAAFCLMYLVYLSRFVLL